MTPSTPDSDDPNQTDLDGAVALARDLFRRYRIQCFWHGGPI